MSKNSVLLQQIHQSLAEADLEADACVIENACTFCDGDATKLSVITGSDISSTAGGLKFAAVLRRTKSERPSTFHHIEPENYEESDEHELH